MIYSWFTSGIFVQVFRDYFFFLIEYLLLTYPIQIYLILVSTNHSNKKSIQFCNIPRADSIMRVACIHVYVIYTHIRRKPRWKIFWMEDFFFLRVYENVRCSWASWKSLLHWNISQRIVKLDLLDTVLSPLPRYCFPFLEIWVVHIMYKLSVTVYRIYFYREVIFSW